MEKPFNRREFLQTAAGLGIAGLVPGCSDSGNDPAGQGSGAPAEPAPAITIPGRQIPGTNESLPMVGFGSTAAVRQIPEKGTDELRRIIRTLVDNGASVIDTSVRAEEIDRPFGQLLQDPQWKDRLFVAQKINTLGKENGLEQIRQTESFFGRRPADLIQVESMIDTENHLNTLRQWKADGGTRYIGITTSNTRDHGRMESFMRNEDIDFIQVNYSIPEYHSEERILPLALESGIAVLINSPFNGGEWFRLTRGKQLPDWAADIGATSWAQVNLKYILSNPAVNCVLTETTNPDHLQENIHSALGEMPDETFRQRMKRDILAMI